MKITKLEKKKRLYLMELDNGDKCYITEDTIVRFMLSRDKVISEEELKEIQDFVQFSYGKNLALYHLSFKARTEKEVREYLKKYDIDENIASQVIANLKRISGLMMVSTLMLSSMPINFQETRGLMY